MKTKQLLLTGALSITVATSVFSQEKKNYVEGDLLIQVSDNHEVNSITSQFSNLNMSKGTLISKDMNIWKFHYSNEEISIDEAIEKVYANNNIVTAQRNHIIEHRATPNDSEYDQQWQYNQANDKDIDADLAWDETTGGLTANGDTIVVCVIDDGINFSHPDLIPNLWRNYNEIPGNGIDDDGNGYTDDVRGWNAYDSNDDPAHSGWWEGHGSAVAGIVGAKGNNGQGVAGVNWDVKLMIVKGGGQEAQAIAAYSYALANRKLYNSSNGANGAFVVATNASWGVDNGQASSAPLWCAMYDTLGRHGVLSAGATANANTNVDVDGDLPTQCPSDYLITVTNTKMDDIKETQAGYGTTTIDLGAPGSGTWTVDQGGNGYAAFGGTSGATPHVTGTIGLLYSVACSNFATLATTNPRLAADKVRDFILNGVDANASLDGITTTGGRLNVNNAVQALITDCPNLLGIEEQTEVISSLTSYPNPLNGSNFTIEFTSELNAKTNIEIIDITGKVVYLNSFSTVTGFNKLNLNLSDLAKGMYQVKMVTNEQLSTLKLVK